nr:energy transducer TonB [Stenotrophomonas mori]
MPAPAVDDRQPRPLAGNPAPPYPPDALRDGVQGRVIARLSVDADGTVSAARIDWHDGPPHRALDQAVLETVRGWHFEPAMRDGHAVDSVVRVPVDFSTGR